MVLIFDADNTIWDTDAVFRKAQLALLKVFAKANLIARPNLELKVLRDLDMALAKRLGHAEYDFKLLAAALAYYYSQKSTILDAVDVACVHPDLISNLELTEIIEEAYKVFQKELKRVPPFYPETIPVLSAIRSSKSEVNPLVQFFSLRASEVDSIIF